MLGIVHHGGKKKSHWVVEAIGWAGAICVLVAYCLVLFGTIEGDGFWNAFLNLMGALGIMVIAIHKKVAQSIVLNAIWIVIALIAIFNLWLK
jgi:hypothetical protein